MSDLHIHQFDVVESTNDVALRMARNGAPDGTVVLAGSQTSGRGRLGRKWIDEPGSCVLMSIIVRGARSHAQNTQLGFAASLAVRDCLADQYGLQDVVLKWPNDVLARGRKIAGILVETTTGHVAAGTDDTGAAAVVGVGINVRQRVFPPDLADSATSVAIETGCEVEVYDMAVSVAKCFTELAETARVLGFPQLAQRWTDHMWGLGCQVEVKTGALMVQGQMAGLDPIGALLIESDGQLTRVTVADSIRRVSSEISKEYFST